MLESEMSAQEQAVTEKVSQHMREQYYSPPHLPSIFPSFATQINFFTAFSSFLSAARVARLLGCCVLLFTLMRCRFQQELAKISAQHAADVAALQQAHEAEISAAHAREEANLMQVRA